MPPKILLSRLWPDGVVRALAERFDVTVDPQDRPLAPAELADAMRTFDALCPTVSDRISADIIGMPDRKVQILANYGAGIDHIDVAAAKAAGLAVTNTPDVLTEATAELAILLMVMVARRAGEGERQLRAGEWTGWRPTHLMGRSLNGGKLGLVGFGRIAQLTALMAKRMFAMEIAYHARQPRELTSELQGAVFVLDLDQLLATSDVISFHCPGGAETHHLLDRRRLALLKRGSIVINTARGSVIDEEALAEALSANRIAGAGLDVYEDEPRVSPALLQCEHTVLLPHLGSATLETRTAMGMTVLANLDAFFNGRPLPNHVA
ncbi:2-hydroxyacid dehydrogenase [Sphingobium mellinum]|uniref:2-hydroxyacid dehydrogenase n=1 Tax=Sphingobium mellinum TaxID=1387166 RepID=UPI0030EDBDF7